MTTAGPSAALSSPAPAPAKAPTHGAWDEPVFLAACRRRPVPHTPVWLMRQAGRYMAEYRAVRDKVGFLELCKTPELACEVTVTAARRLGVDAAILFADILLILEAMGLGLEFTKGDGPVLHNPVRTGKDVDRLHVAPPESLEYVHRAVRLIAAELPRSVPLIGFAGAPFTLASYAIEGGGSRNYEHTKRLMHGDTGAWHALAGRIADSVTDYLLRQIAAGARAVQLFDSWVGCLSPADYRKFVFPHSRRILAAMPADVVTLHFGTGNPELLPVMAEAGGHVIGVDFRIGLDDAWDRLGGPAKTAVQGNMDPVLLTGSRETALAAAGDVMRRAAGRPGHIFNLGHGILPDTPVDNAIALVDFVHAYRAQGSRE